MNEGEAIGIFVSAVHCDRNGVISWFGRRGDGVGGSGMGGGFKPKLHGVKTVYVLREMLLVAKVSIVFSVCPYLLFIYLFILRRPSSVS